MDTLMATAVFIILPILCAVWSFGLFSIMPDAMRLVITNGDLYGFAHELWSIIRRAIISRGGNSA